MESGVSRTAVRPIVRFSDLGMPFAKPAM
jgi:hypothetical protein